MQQLMMTVAVTVETAAHLLPESDTRPFNLFSLLPEQRKTFSSVSVLWGVDVCLFSSFFLAAKNRWRWVCTVSKGY